MKKTIGICFLVVAFAILGTAVGSTDLAVRSTAAHFANGGNPPACMTTGSATLATSPTSAVSEAATQVADGVAPPPPDNSGALVADGVVPPPPDPSPSGSLTGIVVPTSSSGLLLADGVVPPPPDPPSPSGSLTGIAVPTSSSGLLLADGVVPPPPDPPSTVC